MMAGTAEQRRNLVTAFSRFTLPRQPAVAQNRKNPVRYEGNRVDMNDTQHRSSRLLSVLVAPQRSVARCRQNAALEWRIELRPEGHRTAAASPHGTVFSAAYPADSRNTSGATVTGRPRKCSVHAPKRSEPGWKSWHGRLHWLRGQALLLVLPCCSDLLVLYEHQPDATNRDITTPARWRPIAPAIRGIAELTNALQLDEAAKNGTKTPITSVTYG
jgi:hypothetical protein